tara:strand:- start:149 stop:661 length:513 start_codon:yes stop_codon:yes gene_type:complete
MKNPLRIRTNSHSGQHFDVYLYDDKKMYESDVDEILHQDDQDILYNGPSAHLPDERGKIELDTHVSYFDETSRETKFGTVIDIKSTPYFIIQQDKSKNRQSVHRKHVKSTSPTFSELSKMYVQKIAEHNYRKYDLGVVKIEGKTFLTAEESLADLIVKGRYVILSIVTYA